MNTDTQSERLRKKIHHNRPDLIGEHKHGDTAQLILLGVFLLFWITDSFILKVTILDEYVPGYIKYSVAIAVLAVAGYLSWAGLRTVFGKVREKPEIISCGVFSIVRHPIYLGCILSYLGMIISTMSVISFILWIIIVVFYYLISRYEEHLLLNHFGQEYEEYRKKVPMLFPIRFR
jgi:protein-S-isoprenylcysteine O-methyltransferase Ste14